MPVRPLVLYPDRRLRLKAQPVTEWNDSAPALAADVIDTMRAVGAVGLTASHIGDLRRLVVIRLEPADLPRTFVNPEVVWASPERAAHTEGSVSMPGATEQIERRLWCGSATRTCPGLSARKRHTAFGLRACSMRLISWMACSGSTACRGSNATASSSALRSCAEPTQHSPDALSVAARQMRTTAR